jgi:kynurenine formamidase
VDGHELTGAATRHEVAVEPGDVVLVRTGWSRHWQDPPTFNGLAGGYPGLTADGADWLIDREISLTGSDTPAYEVAPDRGVSVHARLLVDAGIQIIENLELEELARDGIYEFLFVALPLRLVGGTASPVRPVALS